MDLIIVYINIIGSLAFAISGALTAMNKRFDLFGVLIISFVTAVGGGTIRDILLPNKAVFWLYDTSYIYVILVGAIIAIVFKSKLNYIRKSLLFFDAIGLGLFTITGVQIGLNFELSIINCIILGAITGSFGGVLRDILVNEVPVIFKKEIYATVSIVGGAIYLTLHHYNVAAPIMVFTPIIIMIAMRLIVIYYNVSLPNIYRDKR